MIVLADSSPLITLARARCFELLHEFYGEVVVSREVHDEIAVAGAGLPGAGPRNRHMRSGQRAPASASARGASSISPGRWAPISF